MFECLFNISRLPFQFGKSLRIFVSCFSFKSHLNKQPGKQTHDHLLIHAVRTTEERGIKLEQSGGLDLGHPDDRYFQVPYCVRQVSIAFCRREISQRCGQCCWCSMCFPAGVLISPIVEGCLKFLRFLKRTHP